MQRILGSLVQRIFDSGAGASCQAEAGGDGCATRVEVKCTLEPHFSGLQVHPHVQFQDLCDGFVEVHPRRLEWCHSVLRNRYLQRQRILQLRRMVAILRAA